MRSTISASLVAICCVAFHAAGCAESSTNPDNLSGGGAGGEASVGGAGGQGGEVGSGGSGGAACVPATEQCDGMDNDCDNQVDEDCPCVNGQTQSCYSGPMETKGVGSCMNGTQTCDLQGVWGPCMGAVLPKTETCNNLDDDCNGTADDMGTVSCGFGACRVTVIKCENGQPNTCTPGLPVPEQCDGLDNDCDQLVDETYPGKGGACDTGVPGACAAGKTNCDNGTVICVQDVMPAMETCNSIDDDCNGQVDDNLPGTGIQCGTGLLGVCSQGLYKCQNNVVDCFPVTPPSAELCNGLDDDCDGTTDEGNPEGGAMCTRYRMANRPDQCRLHRSGTRYDGHE